MRRKISAGRVFQKGYTDRQGRRQRTTTWYLKFYRSGKAVEMSSGTDDYDAALAQLRKKMAESPVEYSDNPSKVKMDQLFDLMIEDYRFKKQKSTYDTEKRVDAHLRPFFGGLIAPSITTAILKQYTGKRVREDAAEATINKELAYVRRSMKLGARQDPPLVLRVPAFDMFRIDNAREGVMSHEQYRAIRDALPKYARIALVIGYHTGARKGEICSIRIKDVDLKAKRIIRPGRVTKNGHARYLPIYGDMGPEIEMAVACADKKCPFLMQQRGARVVDFEKAWATASEAANAHDVLFHDLRRTAVANMIEAGLSEKEAMEISGHRTRAVFDRYHIVSDRRMKQNAEKLGEHLKAKEIASAVSSAGEDGGDRQNHRLM
jgi:integrase